MTCSYCRANNDEDAHRCQRCGRRLTSAPVIMSAAAPELKPDMAVKPEAARVGPELRVVPPSEARPAGAASAAGYQASLFGLQEVPRQAPQARPVRTPPPQQRTIRREKPEHPTLDFGPEPVRTLKTSVAAAIYCDAKVAIASYRAMAAIIDTLIGLLGTAFFVMIARYGGWTIVLNKPDLIVLGIATMLISVFYRVLYCLGNCDSLGLRATNLRLVDVSGHLPRRRERFYRLAGGCVSFMAIGIGLLWAIFDEERLTWHDHMSNTFPTMRTGSGQKPAY